MILKSLLAGAVLAGQMTFAFDFGPTFDGLNGLNQLASVQKAAVKKSADVLALSESLGGEISSVKMLKNTASAVAFNVSLNNGCQFQADVIYGNGFFNGISDVDAKESTVQCN